MKEIGIGGCVESYRVFNLYGYSLYIDIYQGRCQHISCTQRTEGLVIKIRDIGR